MIENGRRPTAAPTGGRVDGWTGGRKSPRRVIGVARRENVPRYTVGRPRPTAGGDVSDGRKSRSGTARKKISAREGADEHRASAPPSRSPRRRRARHFTPTRPDRTTRPFRRPSTVGPVREKNVIVSRPRRPCKLPLVFGERVRVRIRVVPTRKRRRDAAAFFGVGGSKRIERKRLKYRILFTSLYRIKKKKLTLASSTSACIIIKTNLKCFRLL